MNNGQTPKELTVKGDKIVVSRFEYAIMEAANIRDIEKYRPITPDEESARRRSKVNDFFSRIKTKS